MSEFCFLTDELISQQMAQRAAAAERSRYPGDRRPRGRHAFSQRLRRLADRIDQ
jgi:hypothetical protein